MNGSSAPTIDEGIVARRSPNVHTVEIDAEAVLLDEAAQRLHHLNATAAIVWGCFDGASTIREIVHDLSEVLGVPVGSALDDTLAVARQLLDQGLILDADESATTAARWRRSSRVLWRRSLDAVLLLAPGLEEPVMLTGTGPDLWDLLAEPATLEDLAALLAERYRATPEQVAADLRPVLEELRSLGAIDA